MIIPPFLKKGDTVAIVVTARWFLKADLQKSIELIQSWGLKVKLGASIDKKHHIFGGNDSLRAKDLMDQIKDPQVKAIWCARGGYGSVRLLKHIDQSLFKKYPKWLIGYSDVTVLHQVVQYQGIVSLHAIMPYDLYVRTAISELSKQTLKMALFGQELRYEFESSVCSIDGQAEGRLIGGNLSILSTLDRLIIPFEGHWILFIEEIDEYLYHIDRMLYKFSLQGVFEKLSGVVIGGMTSIKDNAEPFGQSLEEVIVSHFKSHLIPVAFGFKAGHLNDNLALKLGGQVSLKVRGTDSELCFLN